MIVSRNLGIGNLRIIADDLGLNKSINDGIIFLLKGAKIDGASLMANGPAFDDAVHRCLEVELPNIGVHPVRSSLAEVQRTRALSASETSYGIHLVLVEERPITQTVFPKNHRIFFIKYILGLISLKKVEAELMAQLNKCIQAGIKPSFINSHQHLHLLPGITEIVVKLAKERQIPYIRIVNEPFSFLGGKLFRKLQLLFLNFLSAIAKRKVRKAGLVCNDFSVGFVNAGNLSDRDIKSAKELLKKYPDKIIELGCHPGHENDELRKKYKNWGNYNWEEELTLLNESHAQ